MLAYPVKLKSAKEGGFVVTFPDIPEAITQGEDREDALTMAAEALETALDFYFETRRQVPAPSKAKRGQASVGLPLSVSAKVLLWNEMLRKGVKAAELARRLRTTPQEVNRMTDIRHATKIDTLAKAMAAVGGRKLVIKAVAA
jgi:antitoxin HicB